MSTYTVILLCRREVHRTYIGYIPVCISHKAHNYYKMLNYTWDIEHNIIISCTYVTK